MKTVRKLGRNLRRGDSIVFVGGAHRIVAMRSYPECPVEPALTAVCEADFTITVHPDELVEVAR